MSKKRHAWILVTLTALASTAKAEEDFHFRLGHNVLLQTWTQNKVAGTSWQESSTQMFKGGWEFYTYGHNLNFYVYPGQEGSSAVVGYSVLADLELGLGLSIQAFSRDKGVSEEQLKEERSASTFSPYITKYVTLHDKATLELTLSPSFTQSRVKQTATDGTSTTATDHASGGTITALCDYKFGSAFHYYGSLAYTTSTAKGDNSQSQILLVPFGVRYDLR